MEEAAAGIGNTFELSLEQRFAAMHRSRFLGEWQRPLRQPIRRTGKDSEGAPDFSTICYAGCAVRGHHSEHAAEGVPCFTGEVSCEQCKSDVAG